MLENYILPRSWLARSSNPFRPIKEAWQTQYWQLCTPRQVQTMSIWYKLAIQNYLPQRKRPSPRSIFHSQLVQKQIRWKSHKASSLMTGFLVAHLGLIMMWFCRLSGSPACLFTRITWGDFTWQCPEQGTGESNVQPGLKSTALTQYFSSATPGPASLAVFMLMSKIILQAKINSVLPWTSITQKSCLLPLEKWPKKQILGEKYLIQ